MALIGFIYWSGSEGRAAKILAAIHGIAMSATRMPRASATAGSRLANVSGCSSLSINSTGPALTSNVPSHFRPAATLKVLREARELGIPAVWMQPGSFDVGNLPQG